MSYWNTPIIGEGAVLTRDVLDRVYALASSCRPQPDRVVLHPETYKLYKRIEQWHVEKGILLNDQGIREAWMAGWGAANGRRKERRKQREYVKWVEAEAWRRVDIKCGK